ncbi:MULTISPECIES: Arm DNA-binding domain-containing protein [unclassified Pseudomonas]|nr:MULTISPECIES: DUF3596 domain-containing protein [unclassified Pseudomonas]
MGRDGGGVRAASASSIEITFQYQGVRCRERVALKPTTANLKKAEQHKAAIEYSIANGTFDYAATFPKSKRAGAFRRTDARQTIGGLPDGMAGEENSDSQIKHGRILRNDHPRNPQADVRRSASE